MNINDLWRTDIENAPKSYFDKTEYKAAGQDRSLTKLVSVYFLATYPDGKTVAKTRWLPDEERFEGMTKDQTPLAWMYWPEPYGAAQ